MWSRIQAEIDIDKGTDVIPFFTDGSWSVHQLLEFILNKIGPSEIKFTAFSLSEESVRVLFFLKDKGLITKLTCVLNKEIRRFKTDLTLFLSNICNEFRFNSVHAKVFILSNDNNKIVIVTSQNFTNNRRYEAGVIFYNSVHFDFYDLKFTELWNKSMI